MNQALSDNTKAILLLTAPLRRGRGEAAADALTPGEYNRVARVLHEQKRQPADLLSEGAASLLDACRDVAKQDRLERLLGRGFLLSQAIERWSERAIWVTSRADPGYPARLKTRLKEHAPAVIYGCGDAALQDSGGLAVVGSRDADAAAIEFTESVGRLAAAAKRTIVSGGARGIDQASMRGALMEGGRALGVLADGLDRASIAREHREFLIDGRLLLLSPYDPAAGFNVGHAMQRNKLIYALADAALVVCSDHETGGTWNGAVEQLDKLRLVPVYVHEDGGASRGLKALRKKGALPWPNPTSAESMNDVFDASLPIGDAWVLHEPSLFEKAAENSKREVVVHVDAAGPAEELFMKVAELLRRMSGARTEANLAKELGVQTGQMRVWLKRLVQEGALEKLSKPTRYRSAASAPQLFQRATKSK